MQFLGLCKRTLAHFQLLAAYHLVRGQVGEVVGVFGFKEVRPVGAALRGNLFVFGHKDILVKKGVPGADQWPTPCTSLMV